MTPRPVQYLLRVGAFFKSADSLMAAAQTGCGHAPPV